MEIFICIDEDKNLHSIEWDEERNKEQKQISLSGSEYDSLITEKEGEEQAKETLEDLKYWEDIGYLSENMPPVLRNNIDFKNVAEEVISCDGWYNVNGEYQYFGVTDNEHRYFSLSGCGQHDSWRKRKIKKWLIPKEDALRLLAIWDKHHIKKIPLKTFNKLFDEIKEIIERNKLMSDRQQVLNKFGEC